MPPNLGRRPPHGFWPRCWRRLRRSACPRCEAVVVVRRTAASKAEYNPQPGASDNPSDNSFRQHGTQRDASRRRNLSDLQKCELGPMSPDGIAMHGKEEGLRFDSVTGLPAQRPVPILGPALLDLGAAASAATGRRAIGRVSRGRRGWRPRGFRCRSPSSERSGSRLRVWDERVTSEARMQAHRFMASGSGTSSSWTC